MNTQIESASNSQRVVRVFVSSTFADMQAERDELVRHVFPKLRKFCEQRGVAWTAIDLRWGITDEQVAEGAVLPICLREIDNCRPFLLGLLGERYGWIPEDLSNDLIEKEPWLNDHRKCSVTELEILHGVLNNPDHATSAFVYFRDPGYIDQAGKQDGFVETDADAIAKLHDLKSRIRDSDVNWHDNYPDPHALGQWVLEDLTSAIEKEFPAESRLSSLDQDSAEHDAFGQSRVGTYIGRNDYFQRLDDHVASKDPPLIVLGDSGAGKSALLANWAVRCRNNEPNALVLTHHIGATAHSTDVTTMLRRVLGEIKRHFEIEEEIPDQPNELRTAFPNWLRMAGVHGRVVLALDALNQLGDHDDVLDLGWLPTSFPENVRLIVTTLPGRSMDNLTARGWSTMTVEPLSLEERQEFVSAYLGTLTRSLRENQIEQLATATQTSNPLYLKTLLDELCIVGSHERLEDQIRDYLEAKDIPALFEKIIDRYENDYERERPNLVADSMSLIWASRRGLSEVELLDLLGRNGEPMPWAHWANLRFAADQLLIDRSGLLGFTHDYLRQTIEKRYMQTDVERNDAHIRLAEYFEPQETSRRKVDELPWQLASAGELDRLKNCLVDLKVFFELNHESTRHELHGYWRQVADKYDLAHEYTIAVDKLQANVGETSELIERMIDVSWFLIESVEFEAAESLLRRVLAIVESNEGVDHPRVATILNSLTLLLRRIGKHSDAEPLCRRAVEIDKRSFGATHPGVASGLNMLAGLLEETGQYAEAETNYRLALAIIQTAAVSDKTMEAKLLNNLAGLLEDTNRYSEAESMYHRALAINESIFGTNHPEIATNVSNLAGLLFKTDKHVEAEPLHRRALAIDEVCFGMEHPKVALRLNNLATHLLATNRISDAEPLLRRALSITETAFGPDHPEVANRLNNFAALIEKTGRHSDAEPLFRRALQINETSFGPDHPTVSKALTNLAGVLRDTGRFAEAEPMYQRALTISETTFGNEHPEVAVLLANFADQLQKTGRMSEAETMYHRALAIMEAAFGSQHSDVSNVLDSLGTLLIQMGRVSEAEPYCRQALEIDESLFGADHPTVARRMHNLAEVLRRTKRHAEAEPLFRQALSISESSFGSEHPQVASDLNALAVLCRELGCHDEAEQLYHRALAVNESMLGNDHPDVASILNNLAALLMTIKRYEESEKHYRRALEINEASLGPDHPNTAKDLHGLSTLRFLTNRITEAEPLLTRAVSICQQTLGHDHPLTKAYFSNLQSLLMKK